MLGKSEWPDSINDLAEFVLEAVADADANDTEADSTYITKSKALANAAAAAFHFASVLLKADDWQEAYAQALFLHSLDTPGASFKIIYGDDVLIPGQVEANFTAMDEWFTHLEHTVMPARARALLHHYGDDIPPETRDHWASLANLQK